MISTTLDNLMVEEEEEDSTTKTTTETTTTSDSSTVKEIADATQDTTATNGSNTTTSSTDAPTTNPTNVDASLKEMMALGYSNDGGWLTQLLVTKNGNVEEALKTLGKMEKPKDEKKTE